MSELDNNIDIIFKEGLQEHSVTPPAYVWNSVNEKLHAAKVQQGKISFWRGTAAAATIIIAFLSSLLFLNIDKNLSSERHNTVLENNKQNAEIQSQSNDIELKVEKVKNVEFKTSYESYKYAKSNSAIIDKPQPKKAEINSTHKSRRTAPLSNKKQLKNASLIEGKATGTIENEVLKTIVADTTTSDNQNLFPNNNESAILAKTNKQYEPIPSLNTLTHKVKTKLSYTISGQIAPGYSDKEINGNTNAAIQESGINTLAGGLNLNVKTRKRWSFETGLYYAQAGQSFTNNVYTNTTTYTSSAPSGGMPIIKSETETETHLNNSLGNIKLHNDINYNIVNRDILENSNHVRPSSPAPASGGGIVNSPSVREMVGQLEIQQELDFIEVPLLVRYHLVDRAFNISLAGGMSTNFLVANNVYYMNEGKKLWIGETENINNINYSAVLGLGVNTPIWKTIHFNIEPRLKYFVNSVSSDNSNNYKPYSLGVYTGISYRFK